MPTDVNLDTGEVALEDAQVAGTEETADDDPVRNMLATLRKGKTPKAGEARAVAKSLAPNQLRILVAILLESPLPSTRLTMATALDIASSFPVMD